MRVTKEIVDRDFIDITEGTPEYVFNYNSVQETLKQLQNKCNFVINDIFLPIAPLSINIQKDNFNWGYKTLRTKTTTKLASGRGQILIQLKLLFTSEMILMLHRLIIQVRNNPFVYIDNQYIKDSIGGYDIRNLHCTVVGLRISSYQPANSSFEMELDLKLFNYTPYSLNLNYISELETLYTSEANNKYTSLTFPVFATKVINNKLSYEPLLLEYEFSKEEKTPVISTQVNSNLSIFKKFKKYADSGIQETFPYNSSAYVRYYNWLQIKSLSENFGINITRGSTTDATPLSLLNKDLLDKGIVSGFNKIVVGLHSCFIPYDIKKYIIESMLAYDKTTKFYYNEYEHINLRADVLKRYRQEIMYGTEGLTGEERDKKIFENNKRILEAITKNASEDKGQ